MAPHRTLACCASGRRHHADAICVRDLHAPGRASPRNIRRVGTTVATKGSVGGLLHGGGGQLGGLDRLWVGGGEPLSWLPDIRDPARAGCALVRGTRACLRWSITLLDHLQQSGCAPHQPVAIVRPRGRCSNCCRSGCPRRCFSPPDDHMARPQGATGRRGVIEERAVVDDFLGDFEYVLTARMSESSFREWMRRLQVAPTDDPNRYGLPHDYIEHECGSEGRYADGVAEFHAWCS